MPEVLKLFRQVVLALGGAGLVLAPAARAEERQGIWTAETSVNLRYEALDFDQPYLWPAVTLGGKQPEDARPALFSPDNRHFITASVRADLATDREIIDLKIFSSKAVRQALSRGGEPSPLEPAHFLSFSSTSPVHAMSNIRWGEGGKAIFFNGADSDGAPHAYRIDVATGEVADLAAYGKSRYSFSYSNGSSVYYGFEFTSPPRATYPASWIGRKKGNKPTLSQDDWHMSNQYRAPTEAWARCDDGEPIALPSILTGDVATAPAGCRAIIVDASNGGFEYRLLDLRTGKSSAIAPTHTYADSIVWSPDGKNALLSMVIENGDTSTPRLGLFDLETGALDILEGVQGDTRMVRRGNVRWLSNDRLFVRTKADDAGAGTLFEWDGSGWAGRPGSADLLAEHAPPEPGFQVVLEQGTNTPGTVLARNATGEVVLTAPDPILQTVKRGNWQEFTWEEEGETHTGVIMLPTGGTSDDGPPPLVIAPYRYQAHAGVFLPDGPHKGGDSAAQALAARGFAVAWFDAFKPESLLPIAEQSGNIIEGDVYVNRVDAVIDALSRRKLIDPKRVGIAGFSRSAYLSLYHATHPGKYAIGAYVWADGGFDMLGKSIWNDHASIGGYYVHYKGSFFQNRALWDRLDTLRHVDKVGAPILFTFHASPAEFASPQHVETQLAGFVDANRPFDVVYFPDGEHQLQRPRHRYIIINAITDWFAFWLKGEAPSDAERADVWNTLKVDWDRQQAWEAQGNPVASQPTADFEG